MALAAQNVAVTVGPAAAVQLAAVHHRYPRRPLPGGALRLELGDLYAQGPRSLLVEFLLSGDAGGAETDVATLTLEGHVLLPGGGVEKRTVALPIRVAPGEGPVAQPGVRRELLLLEASHAREAALEERGQGQVEDAARTLRRAAERLAPYAPDDAEIQDQVDDLRDMAERLEEERLTVQDAKWMHQRATAARRASWPRTRRLAAERRRKRGAGGE